MARRLTILVLLVLLTPARGSAQYAIADLGLPGTWEADAYGGVNNSGMVVGSVATAIGSRAFVYDPEHGGFKMLVTPGVTESRANDVNNVSVVVGRWTTTNGPTQAFRYTWEFGEEGLQSRVSLGGANSSALGINDGGDIVGWATTVTGVPHAFLYRANGQLIDLHAAAGWPAASGSVAQAIDNQGRIVGVTEDGSGNSVAFSYSPGDGSFTTIGTLGGATSALLRIAQGLAVGAADVTADEWRAVLFQDGGSLQDLGTLGGAASSGMDINAVGEVVGSARNADGEGRAFLYDSLLGMRDLNALLGDEHWYLLEAQGINDSGQIVGIGFHDDDLRVFLLTPIGGERAPTAQDGVLTTAEDTSRSGQFVASPYGTGALTFSVVTPPAHGTVVITNPSNGTFTYVPAPNFNGTDQFTFRATETGGRASSAATMSVTVTPVADAPVAVNGSLIVNEDTLVAGTLAGSDVDGDQLAFSVVTPPSHGALTITDPATGTFSYMPAANYNGADSFGFRVSDGATFSNTATIAVTVIPVDDPLVATNGSLDVVANTTGFGVLVATDADGEALTFSVESAPSHGVVTITNATTGVYYYEPAASFTGADSFTFRANDAGLSSNVASVAITVSPGATTASLHSIGDLPGGPFVSVVRDATRANGVLYAVGASAGNIQVECVSPNNPAGCVTEFNPDTAVLWSSDGTTTTLTPLPHLVTPGSPSTNSLIASAISRDAAYLASQARSSASIPNQARAVRVTRAGLVNLDLSAPPFPPTSPPVTGAQAISEDGGILYGVTGIPRRAVRFDVNASSVTMIPLLPGDTWSEVAGRGVSFDGSVMVGTSAVTQLTGINGHAFRYVHASPVGAVSALPLLAGGTWNKALAVSPDGRLTLVAGNSAFLPNGEVYLFDAVTGVTTSLGSPNTPWIPANLGGMTADGSVVATTFLRGTDDNGIAYIRNVHGWFQLTTILAEQGINLAAAGWELARFQINGVSPDGTLVWGVGERDGNNEGFVVEFPAGYLASFDLPAVPPADTSIVGVWGGGLDVFMFLADGTYFHLDGIHGSQQAGQYSSGFERGRYRWDATGAFSWATLQDTNGSVGLSGGNGILGLTAAVYGDTLEIGFGGTVGLAMTRMHGDAASIVGGWVRGDPRIPNNSAVVVFNPDGTYIMGDDFPSGGAAARDGVEAGTYVWAADGTFAATSTIDMNGSAGFTNGVGAGATFVLRLSPDGLRLGGPGSPLQFARSVDEQTVVPVITSALVASGIQGSPFAYTVTATYADSFGATGLPSGLSIDTATGLISGTPTVAGTFNVAISATNSLNTTTSASLTITLSAPPPPVAQNGSFSTLEDTPISGTVVASDPSGGPLVFSVVAQPVRGTVVITDPSTGAFTYTPALNRFGGDTFTFQASAGGQTSNIATVTISITPVNDAPQAVDSTVDATEDTPLTGMLLASDPDSLVVQFEVVSQPAHGTVTIPGGSVPPLGGSFTYVPQANYNGPDSFTYRVVDGTGVSNVATVTIAIAPVNDAPAASSVAVTMQEGIAKDGVLVATDVDDAVLTFSIATPPTKGTVTVTDATTGAFAYTPNAGAVGYDSFTFRATDVSGESSTATGMAFVVASSQAWPGQTARVARAFSASFFPFYGVPSGDGRWIAYCANSVQQFLLDRATGQVEQVSVASDGTPANDIGCGWSMSPDGRYLAFPSHASNLVTGDTNGVPDIFLRDRQTGMTARVSLASDGSQSNGGSWDGATSADGRFVAFVSEASNLVEGDSNGARDVFVHDRATGRTSRVSVASDGTQGNANSEDVTMSADGRFVAFQSLASNLVAGDTNGRLDAFVHDRVTGQTSRVSVLDDGTQPGVQSIGLPSLSADGRHVAFATRDNDVFVHDRATGQTSMASITSAGAPASGFVPTLSADGRYVGFSSGASFLVPGDTNLRNDMFVYDRQTGETVRVSVATDGSQGNGQSQETFTGRLGPVFSADGRSIVFSSLASNFAAPDTTGTYDVFVVGGVAVDPISINVPAAGGPRSVNVSFDYPGTPWTATTTTPWITLDAPAGGSANGVVSFTIAPNTGPTRTGTIVAALHTVTITQEGPTAPVAQDGALITAEDSPAAGTLNAADPNGNPLVFALVAPPAHGAATITNASTGAFTYTPAADYNGPDSFTFSATDGSEMSNVSTVSVTVTPVNDAPVAVDRALAVDHETATTGTFAATDVDGPALSFEIVTNGSRGTATITNAATGAFTYVPNAGASGSDSILFRVSDGSLTSVGTVSITIAPSPTPTVVVRTPNGGERVFVNTQTTIQWSATGAISSFDVELSRNSGSTFAPIPGCMGLPGTASTCAWTPTTPTSATAMIRVTGRGASGINASDRSDGPFSIVTGVPMVAVSAPNTAVTWSVGTARVITWTHNLGSPSFVRVELTRDGGASWETLAASVQNATVSTGTLNWVTSGPATTNALVRVSTLDGSASDVSNVPFTIQAPTVTVTSPNTAVTWRAGTNGPLTFRHNLGAGQVVHLDVSRDDGATWTRVTSVTTTATPTATYAWPVTAPATTQGRVRATWAANAAVSDVSDVAFTITPRIRVLSPNTATTWSAGTTRTISWNHNLPAGATVDIAFSPDIGASWIPVASGVPNQSATSGAYTGRFPATLTTQGLVRVSSSSNAIDSDVNDVPLIVIAPTVTVTAPGMNTTWPIGSARTIAWTHNLGTAESVAIEISRDGGVSWTSIVASTPNSLNTSGSFAWTVTGPATSTARLRVSWTIDGTVQGVSGSFRVQ